MSTIQEIPHRVVAPDEWLSDRKALLEKEVTRRLDALIAKRRALPWIKVDSALSSHRAAGGMHQRFLVPHHATNLVHRRGQIS